MKEANEFSLNAIYKEKREAKEAFERELKTANNKIEGLILQSKTATAEVEQLKVQSVKHQERIEILKSKNNFLSTQASILDKNTLKELETLRAKVAEQEKEIFNLTAKVGCYENKYLKNPL
jgi:chromosome segregation ATPase